MNYVVYACIFENGKKYVGISNNFQKRVYHHKWLANQRKPVLPFHKALKKHKNSYTWFILYNNLSLNEAKQIEIAEIHRLNSMVGLNGYNCTKGGDGTSGYTKSKESIDKWRASTSIVFKSEEYRERLSKSVKFALGTHDAKKNMSESQRKRFQDKQEIEKMQIRARQLFSRSDVKEKMSKGQCTRFSKQSEIEKCRNRAILQFSNEKMRVNHAKAVGARFFDVYKDNQHLGDFLTQTECAKALGIHRKFIGECLNNKRSSYKGFSFKYKE